MMKAVENQQLSLFYNLKKIGSWIFMNQICPSNLRPDFSRAREITLKKSETSAGGLTSFSPGLNPH